jgi:prepilin-type N-terminal cleavage/methylation domain-containing protein
MKPTNRNLYDRFGRPSGRGFTLIELLVAVMAGLFVSIAAIALARQGSTFFQQEARIANAQFGATLGFERLRADIARAGFMTSANVWNDPLLCPRADGNWPNGMKQLSAIHIEEATPTDVRDNTNHLFPDQITLSGSYSSVEWFPVAGIIPNGTTKYDVYLQLNNGAIARSGGATKAALGPIFQKGRMLRLLDMTGHFEYGAIDDFDLAQDGHPVVKLGEFPPITRMAGTTTCGVQGNGTGMLANVVNLIRYRLHKLSSAPGNYAPLYDPAAAGPGDDSRFELIRVEVDAAGAERRTPVDTLEVVAEYAVDLKFGLSAVTLFNGFDPTLTQYEIGDPLVYSTWAAAPKGGTPGPERIRSVRVRLAVRSREGDRQQNIGTSDGGVIFRYAMPDGRSFARVRTLTADIALPNLTGIAW